MPISPSSTLIGHIIVDAVTRMVPRKRKKLTKHPIETGANVAEHIADDEDLLILDVTFTDDVTPLGTSIPGATADDKRAAVTKIMGKIVNIETPRESFPSYVLLDIDQEVTVRNSSAFQATLTFDKAIIAQVGLASLPLTKVRKRVGDKKTGVMKQLPSEDMGVQSTDEIDSAQAEADAAVAALVSAL